MLVCDLCVCIFFANWGADNFGGGAKFFEISIRGCKPTLELQVRAFIYVLMRGFTSSWKFLQRKFWWRANPLNFCLTSGLQVHAILFYFKARIIAIYLNLETWVMAILI